jgi:hypothetical protein
MNLFDTKRKTVGRSFRVDEQWLAVLNEEAKKQGVSVNSLLNRLLQQYAYLRYMLRYGAITLTRQGFMEILECCTDEKIKEKGKNAGANIVKDLLRTMGVPPTYGIILCIVKKLLSEFAGWFECDHHIKPNKEILHFRHDLGPKWSIYLAAITEGTFNSLLDAKIDIETTKNSVTVTIQKQQIK